MRLWEQLVSLVALAVIFGSLGYACERESMVRSDLNPVFQRINQEYFDGSLQGISVEWTRLPDDERGEARKLAEHEYVILVDRRENRSNEDVRRTLEHESCHVWVHWKEQEEQAPHLASA